MRTLILDRIKEIKINLRKLEDSLNVKLSLKGNKLTISGSELEEYDAERIINAINFGFSTVKALTLKDPEIVFRILHIKDFTRRKDLKEVRARLIGRFGKTKETIENISNTDIVIHDNEVGVLGSAESIEDAITALKNLIKGSKQANVYRYLEKANVRKFDEGLGLKEQ